jgi:C4-dicarboxylate-specific signal transduction histidine kinase
MSVVLAPSVLRITISLVRCSANEAGLMLNADAGLLEQALINLIHNAMEAFPAPQAAHVPPCIEVRCRLREED